MQKTLAVPLVALALLLCAGPLARAEPAGAKGTVKGKVINADGTPASGATVRLMERAARKPDRTAPESATPQERKARRAAQPPAVAEATANGAGEFTLANVPVGRYVVTARLKGAGNARQPVNVSAENAANVTLTLAAKGAGKKQGKRPGEEQDDARTQRQRAKAAKKLRAQ